jgi:hypothetical protein
LFHKSILGSARNNWALTSAIFSKKF